MKFRRQQKPTEPVPAAVPADVVDVTVLGSPNGSGERRTCTRAMKPGDTLAVMLHDENCTITYEHNTGKRPRITMDFM